ncbi:MAG: phage head closure protein [Lachnospiraceae bacterium]|nr:phage head closure protein [Lachnospiraceae bacterium]
MIPIDDAITLIQEVYDEDLEQYIESGRIENVFCKVESIQRDEFYRAGQNGMKPQYKFVTAKVNYSNEEIIVYRGIRYSVYRTYEVPGTDDIELYAEDMAGVTDV